MKLLNDLYQNGHITKEQFDIYCTFVLQPQGVALLNLWGEQLLIAEPSVKNMSGYAYESGKIYLIRYIKTTILMVKEMISKAQEFETIEKSLL